ncbi:hypothetical protein D3C71_2230980 [compost metagenome]
MGQLLQHPAHHGTAHAEQLAQLRLGQLGARGQAMVEHAVEDGLIDARIGILGGLLPDGIDGLGGL